MGYCYPNEHISGNLLWMGNHALQLERDTRRPPRRLLWVLGVAVGTTVLVVMPWLLTADLGGGEMGEERLEQDVRALFQEADHGDVVTLADATDFEWDAVGVFGPYYPADAINEDMGIAVPRSVSNWSQYESHCLLVFRAGDKVAGWTRVERSVAECADDLSGRVYPAEEARFRGDAFAPAR